jgi:hypothetical protein
MSDLPVPADQAAVPQGPVVIPQPPAPQTLVCANCHATLAGEYCAVCGQRHEPHVHTVAHFAGEAFESISHADSRVWRTLLFLLSKPGRLTREFFDGRRVRYLPPFRLYLVISVLFFLVVGLGGGGRDSGEPMFQIDKPKTAEDIAALNKMADTLESRKAGPGGPTTTGEIAAQLRALAREEAAELEAEKAKSTESKRKVVAAPLIAQPSPLPDESALAPAPPATAEGDDATADEVADAFAADLAEKVAQKGAEKAASRKRAGDADVDDAITIATGEEVEGGIDEFCKQFVEANSKDKSASNANRESVLRWCKRFDDKGVGAIGEALAHNIPRAMFVFLPLLAFCMKLIYWRPKRYYVEHLLFMVHNHAFVFLAATLVMLIGMIPYVGDYAALLYWATFFYMAWYIYRAMRNVYGQGRGLTVVKYFTLGFAYLIAGFTVFALTFVYSTITF